MIYHFQPYSYDESLKAFTPIKFSYEVPHTYIREHLGKGINSHIAYDNALALYGNCYLHIPTKGVIKSFLDEYIAPFYLFQIVSVIFWIIGRCYYFAGVIFVLSIGSAVLGVMEERKHKKFIQKMIGYQCPINVLRSVPSLDNELDTDFINLPSTELVPGDVIEVPSGSKMPCDCILLNGSVLINEEGLMGEPKPILKTRLPPTDDIYNVEDRKHTIYAATEVIQKNSVDNSKVCALVIRTGFSTLNGALIRSVLSEKIRKPSYYSDVSKWILIMVFLSFIAMIVSFVSHCKCLKNKFLESYHELITITVPPILPIVIIIGCNFSFFRLKNKGILCIAPSSISAAAKINVFCFSKNGILTESVLSIHGFIPKLVDNHVHNIKFGHLHKTLKDFQKPSMYTDPEAFDKMKGRPKSLFVECLASCHSITCIAGKLIGDPLEILLFKSTSWVLDEPEMSDPNETISTYASPTKEQLEFDWANDSGSSLMPYQLCIVRRFEYDSRLERMSVLVKCLRDSKHRIFVKGNPKRIKDLCYPYTIPDKYDDVIEKYLLKGYRVIAFATRSVNINYQQAQKVDRDKLENKLDFLGLAILQENIKESIKSAIKKLNEADIKTVVMVEDNRYTAINVAKECGALQGKYYLADFADDKQIDEVQWTLMEERNESTLYSTSGGIKKASNHDESLDERLSESFNPVRAENKFPWEEKDCSIVLTEKALNFLIEHNSENTKEILKKTVVLAEVSQKGKLQLINELKKYDNFIGVYGNSISDCSALKEADVGVALADTEASITALFTTKKQDLNSVFKILKEGRGTLMNSYQCFKFMVMYSMIQFTSVIVFYNLDPKCINNKFFVFGILLAFPMMITMNLTKPASRLSKKGPPKHLISFPVLISIIGHIIIHFTFQVLLPLIYRSLSTFVQGRNPVPLILPPMMKKRSVIQY